MQITKNFIHLSKFYLHLGITFAPGIPIDMPTSNLSRALTVIGILCICHAGYSTVQYRQYLRLVGEEFISAPADVLLECFLGLAIAFVGVMGMSDGLVPIKMYYTWKNKTAEDLNCRTDFQMFNHRGRALGLLLETPLGQNRMRSPLESKKVR